jgi:hypothetical protein
MIIRCLQVYNWCKMSYMGDVRMLSFGVSHRAVLQVPRKALNLIK